VGSSVVWQDSNGDPVTRDDELPSTAQSFADMHPSSYDAKARVAVMDGYGISSAALYPNLNLFGVDIFRASPELAPELSLELLRAYNDFILSWATDFPGRFIPLACIPYWNVEASVAEIERCATLGHRGLVSTGAPQIHEQPFLADHHWDPLWAAAQAAGMPISFHVGGDLTRNYTPERGAVQGMRMMSALASPCAHLDNACIMADLLLSGVLPRFPDLKFIMVESGIGWIPFVLEDLDCHVRKYRATVDHPEFVEPPSFYFHRQIFVNYWFEKLDDFYIERVGVDNLLFETDYPHPACLMGPEVEESIVHNLGGVDQSIRDKILWQNASKLFRWKLAS
jgi:predicted TIM-barrel fold metal-dependent hydrolase